MTLSLDQSAYDRFRSVVANSLELFGSHKLDDVKSFIVDAYALDNQQLVKEMSVEFMADKLQTKEMLGKGCFHVAFKGVDTKGFLWVIKKPLRMDELKEVVPDFLKQNIAHELSRAFTQQCQKTFGPDHFLLYNKPYLAVVTLKFGSGKTAFLKDAFFEMESFLDGSFEYFNRPNGTLNIEKSAKLGPNRLPQVFSKWTSDATGGSFLVNDVQGVKLGRGQYLCTDPIVFTKSGSFGIIDHGESGMAQFLSSINKAMNADKSLRSLSGDLDTSCLPSLQDKVTQIMSLGNRALSNSIPKQAVQLLKDRPTTGVVVRHKSGRWGRIIRDDYDDAPYKVCYSDGTSEWAAESSVERMREKPRPTLKDIVLVNGKNATIVKDDNDGCPYKAQFDNGDVSGYLTAAEVQIRWRPVEGDRVQVGKEVVRVVLDDQSDIPFKVKSDDGTTSWKHWSSLALCGFA